MLFVNTNVSENDAIENINIDKLNGDDMKIGQLVSLHAELEVLINDKVKPMKPRFIYWLKSTIDKTAPVHKNLQESVQGLKSARLLEFEEKRGLLIEVIANGDEKTNQEKEAEYKEKIKPMQDEYADDISEFESKVKDFEESVLTEEENVGITKIKFGELPSLSLQTLQVMHPFIETKPQLKKTKEVSFKNLMAVSELNTDAYENGLKYSIVDFMVQASDTYVDFIDTRKSYQLNEEFGQYALEKTQVHQNVTDEDARTKAFDELHNRYQELYSIETKLDTIMNSDVEFTITSVSVDDLPEEITTAEYEAIEFLVEG